MTQSLITEIGKAKLAEFINGPQPIAPTIFIERGWVELTSAAHVFNSDVSFAMFRISETGREQLKLVHRYA